MFLSGWQEFVYTNGVPGRLAPFGAPASQWNSPPVPGSRRGVPGAAVAGRASQGSGACAGDLLATGSGCPGLPFCVLLAAGRNASRNRIHDRAFNGIQVCFVLESARNFIKRSLSFANCFCFWVGGWELPRAHPGAPGTLLRAPPALDRALAVSIAAGTGADKKCQSQPPPGPGRVANCVASASGHRRRHRGSHQRSSRRRTVNSQLDLQRL